MLQVDQIQSYLNLKFGLPPALKAGSSGSVNISVQSISELIVCLKSPSWSLNATILQKT